MTTYGTEAVEDSGFWRRNLDKIGVGGALFAVFCCLGFLALLSILSAIRLGFIVNDVILVPLLLAFLLAALAGLLFGMRHHRKPWALVLGGASTAILLTAILLAHGGALAGIGITGLVAASLLNVWLRARQLRATGSTVTDPGGIGPGLRDWKTSPERARAQGPSRRPKDSRSMKR